jgi:hypothetical protein
MTKKTRLSSDFLYTYTPSLDKLILILENGLRHSLQEERVLPSQNIFVQNFAVCFCDILSEDSGYHREVYGKYALAFHKAWGIKNGITPVRYIHENSTGTGFEHLLLKNDMRKARESYHEHGTLAYWQDIVLLKKARLSGILTAFHVDFQPRTPEFLNYLEDIDESFSLMTKKIGDDKDVIKIFNDWVLPIINTLEKTIDELERRDSLLRAYQDDFRTIKNKILYDEREWRSVKYIDELTLKAQPDLLNQAISNKYLPPNYNLQFMPADIYAIIVDTAIEKKEIISFIKHSTLPQLIGADTLVMTFDEHSRLI